MVDPLYIFEGTSENFHPLVVKSSHECPVLVDFWAAWCNPCQMLMPIVTRLAEEYQGKFHLVKVNSDEQQALASQFSVRSLPTLKLFHRGEVVEEIMGVQGESVLRELLDKYVVRESDQAILQAQRLVEQEQLGKACALLTQAQQEDPGNQRIPLELVRIHILSGNPDGADKLLQSLPTDQRHSEEAKVLQARIQLMRIAQGNQNPEQLQTSIANDNDYESRYLLAARLALDGDYESSLALLLEIMKKSYNWNNDAARKGILLVFDLLGGQGELVSRYRRQMFNLLH